ncbi:MAG: hypothetical protein IIA66_13615, partial [Planctomycetes bacterium]|nr:hypothetical protein [Planctomycetota bacterium]
MNKLWKLVILCTGCLSLMAADSALADYVGLVHVTKSDEDTVNLCNNANGDDVPEPLDVCNVLAQFTNPVDRLLSVGNGDITASNGLYFQHMFNPAVIAPTCTFVGLFPDLICDTFVTIGYKCGPDPAGTDTTAVDGDFLPSEFANNGHLVGGWFAIPLPDGTHQGDAGTWPCLQVLFLQLSVPTGESITGTISVFATINDEIVAFANQVVDCSGANDCPQGEACYDCDPCTVDDTCDADGNCVGTPVNCDDGDDCNGVETCDPADGSCQDGEPMDCNDNDACTDDACADGNCVNEPIDCPVGEVCDPDTGDCVPEGCPPGKGCDDGNPCTVDDTCDADENCIGTPVDCSAAGDECNTASCDPNGADGNCDILTPLPAGAECGDPNNTDCDNPDTCDGAGACQDNNAPAGDPCGDQGVDCLVDDTCDGAGGCADNGNQPDGSACGSGADTDCDDPDSCMGGACQDNNAPAGDPCGDQGVECLVDDTCNGMGGCTDNGNQADGSACGSGADTECDDPDSCIAGACQDNNAAAG